MPVPSISGSFMAAGSADAEQVLTYDLHVRNSPEKAELLCLAPVQSTESGTIPPATTFILNRTYAERRSFSTSGVSCWTCN